MRLFGEGLREFRIGKSGNSRFDVASGVEMGKKMNNEQLIMNNWLKMVKKN